MASAAVGVDDSRRKVEYEIDDDSQQRWTP
jgi:hypothetical protein